MTEQEKESFEQAYGIPVRPYGSRTVDHGAMIMAIVIAAIALASLLFSYTYIRLQNPVWPPAGVSVPSPLMPMVAVGILILAQTVSPDQVGGGTGQQGG